MFWSYHLRRNEIRNKASLIIYPSECQAITMKPLTLKSFLSHLSADWYEPPLSDDIVWKYSHFTDVLCGFTLESLSPDLLALHYSFSRESETAIWMQTALYLYSIWQHCHHSTLVKAQHITSLQSLLYLLNTNRVKIGPVISIPFVRISHSFPSRVSHIKQQYLHSDSKWNYCLYCWKYIKVMCHN